MGRRRTLLACACLAMLALLAATLVAPRPGPVSATGGRGQVNAGGYQTCAVASFGGAQCWGRNSAGELGAPTTETCGPSAIDCSSTPVDVSGLASGVAAVTMGDSHACALTDAGGVKCWGFNRDGQVGDGTSGNERATPTNVSGLSSGVAAVSAGGYHTCALTTAGAVKCWGYNGAGQLGDGTNVDRAAPWDIPGLASGVTAIAAGGNHTCAVTAVGGVKCWGSNSFGQLGDGTTTSRFSPVDVSGLTSGVASVAAGNYHTCAVTTTGGVKCWGANVTGQLGDGTTVDRSAPVNVSGLATGISDVAVGGILITTTFTPVGHTCAVTTGGSLKCWGSNANGQLGDGTTMDRAAPWDVPGMTAGVTSVAAGVDHTCAATTSGRVKCWGDNVLGQLGDGTATERTAPVDVVDWFIRLALSPALAIPDSDSTGITDAFAAADGATIEDINVFLDISHTWVGDLIVTLTHSDTGTSVALLDRPAYPVLNLGCDGDDVNAVFDDDALSAVEDECDTNTPAINGDFTPNEPLSVFDGESAAGTWMLQVSDVQGGDVGTLNAWSLYVVTSVEKPTPTPTATNTPTSMPTATVPPTATSPVPPTATPPAPTPTTPLGGLVGDVNCDDAVNSIDAALLLQLGAGLIGSLACEQNADTNGNGSVNSIDAALILQFVAGLVATLPPGPSQGERPIAATVLFSTAHNPSFSHHL